MKSCTNYLSAPAEIVDHCTSLNSQRPIPTRPLK